MSDPISFSTSFNQPKIIINSSRTVSVPVTALPPPPPAPATLDTLLTIPTGAPRLPLPPRLFIEYLGTLAPAFGDSGATFDTFGINVAFFVAFDPSFNLIVRSYSQEAAPVNVVLHYRVYRDAEPE